MQILAHRGYWNTIIRNNSPEALRQALEHGYGFETDLRDYCGRLVVSHNIANVDSMEASELFCWLAEFGDRFCFAINIKADGLIDLLADQLKKNNIKNYFTFDMSVPQMLEFRKEGLIYFTRQSEVEISPVLYEDASGVWIDAFFEESWITEALLNDHIARGKKICLVSPELHKRNYLDFWTTLHSFELDFSQVMLCTDYPDKAVDFFRTNSRKRSNAICTI